MDKQMFPDVPPGRWYSEAVETVAKAGLMIGDDKGNFRPLSPLTRAEAAVILYRIFGDPETPVDVIDVSKGGTDNG